MHNELNVVYAVKTTTKNSKDGFLKIIVRK